jgi:DNA-binding PucR family transcriptional regulator
VRATSIVATPPDLVKREDGPASHRPLSRIEMVVRSQQKATVSARPRKDADTSGTRDALADILDDLERVTDVLAERMLKQYLDSIPSYRALPDVTLDQIRELNRANLVGFVAAMRESRGPTPDELAMVRESASRRAREGVPLSALLIAYRTGAQIAWTEARVIIGTDPRRMAAGLDLASAVMNWVDEASGAAAQAYLAEHERLASDREASRRDFVDGALSGQLTPEEILARAEALGLDRAGRYAVAVLASMGEGPQDALLRETRRTMSVDLPAMERSLVVTRGDELVLVFPADDGTDATTEQLRSFLERASGALESRFGAGVGRARESLTELSGSYREASIALAAARAGSSGPLCVYGEVLVEELILRERSVARRLAQAILEPLEGHPDLKATLLEYINHGPSLPAVAKRLYLHPNTVAYRLSRVKDLTGRDPKSPAGVAELFLALRAQQLVGSDAIEH